MSDGTSGSAPEVLEELDEAECLRLISAGGIGRIGYSGRFGPTVLPVNYRLHQGAIVFRTARHSLLGEDLRTGIADAEYKVAFEIDDLNPVTQEGWSVLVRGSAHHVDSAAERASAQEADVQSWAGGERELYLRIVPQQVTGRRVGQAGPPAAG